MCSSLSLAAVPGQLRPGEGFELRVDGVRCGAHFSPCRTWRYALYRVWEETLQRLAVFGLNPSTADEIQDDPTIRRLIRYARDWGFGGLNMGNIFAFRATDPRDMKAVSDPVGPDNDAWLARLAADSGLVLAAWGVHGVHRGREQQVLALGLPCVCLGQTKDGHPKHPLYLRADTLPVPYTPA